MSGLLAHSPVLLTVSLTSLALTTQLQLLPSLELCPGLCHPFQVTCDSCPQTFPAFVTVSLTSPVLATLVPAATQHGTLARSVPTLLSHL